MSIPIESTIISQGVFLPESSPYRNCVAASPAGLCCRVTGNTLSPSTYRTHAVTAHNIRGRLPTSFSTTLWSLIVAARKDPNRDRFEMVGSSRVIKHYCKKCQTAFRDKSKRDQHLSHQSNKGETDKCTAEDCSQISCMKLFCGRYYPVQSPAVVNPLPGSASTQATTVPGNTDRMLLWAAPNLLVYDFSLIGADLGKLCTIGRELSEKTVRSLLPPQSSTDPHADVFHQLISQNGTEESFLTSMRINVTAMENYINCVSSDERLSRLLEAFKLMLANYMGANKMVTRNLTTLLVKFNADDEHGNVHNSDRYSFRERKTQNDILVAFQQLLAFLLSKQSVHLMTALQSLDDTSILPMEIHTTCVIPNLMYKLAAEEPSNREHETLLVEFALSGCFTLQGNDVKFKATGGCSSFLATALYLTRFAMMYKASSILMIQNEPNRNQLVKHLFLQIQGLPTTQNLSKGISSLRIKLKSEAKSDRVRVDSEGNYSHKQAVFRHIYYRGFMKRASSSLHALFTELIDGDDWMACLHEDARFEFGDNSFFGDVVCEVRIDDSDAPSSTVDINEFRLKSSISGRDHILVHKLNSLFQLIFLGLGGGSERTKAIETMTARQVGVVEELSCIYYTLVHNKQYRVETVDRSPSNHKMPDVFFAYYLIFRKIVALLNTEDAEKCLVFINVAKPKWTVSHWMGEFFHINPSFATIPVIRQFFTSITNKTVVVLEKLQSQIRLTANRLAAESCNHSEIAHAENYATLLADADEVFYETYHSILGLPPSHGRRRQPTIFAPSSEARIIEALQAVHGSDADFRSDNQKSMIVASCNEASKHKFFGTACGSGKSSAIVIPPIVQFLSNRAIGTTVVVTPYGFLASTTWASLHDSLQDKFGDSVTVDSFSGSDVLPSASSSFPANLARHPPNILILTLDAAANLIQHHSWALEKWSNEGILRAVKFDEIQTVFTEFGFRKAYQAIAQFAALGCEVTLLSGSCPKKLAFPLMRCLNLLSNNQNESEVTTVFDSDLIGDGFDFISVKGNNRSAANAALLKLVGASLSTGKGHAHVICAEKREAEWLKSKAPQLLLLSKLPELVVELVTAHTPRAEVDRIASAWREGLVHLLITTTCGLVGNENKLARFIFFHHCLYAITNLIQGIGRLRLIQRGPDSVVTHIESDDFIEEGAAASRASQLSRDGDTLIDQLKTVGALNQSDMQIFQEWFHVSGYLSFIKSEGRCQMQLLKEMTGHQGAEACGRCTHCVFHTSFCSVDQARDNFIKSSHSALEEESERAAREIADNIDDNRASNSTTVARRIGTLTRRLDERREQEAVAASQNASQIQAKRRRLDPVNEASIEAQRATAEQSRINQICIQRLADLQLFCANCANRSCNGVACQKSCRVCGDQHFDGFHRPAGIRVCPWASHNQDGHALMKDVGDRGFCAFCLCPMNCFTLSHKKPGVEGTQCSVSQRFVRVVCSQRQRENNQNRNETSVSHRDFVLRITSSMQEWEKFLANARWPNQSAINR